MTNDVNDGKVENIQRIAFVSTAGVAFGMPTIDGKIQTADTPYGYDVAEGNITNHEAFFRLGYTGALGNTSGDLWALGASVPSIPFPQTSGQGFAVYCASTLDMATGTGIRTVVVDYLDTSFNAQSTTLTLSTIGTGVQSSAVNAIRINSLRAETAGTLGKAAGAISVCATAASTQIYRQLAAGETRGRQALFTVPEGKTLYITDIVGGVGAGTAGSYVRMKLVANQQPSNLTTETFYLPYWENILQYGGAQHLDIPIKFGEHVDVKMVAVTNQSSGMAVQCAMRGWLES